MKKRKPDPRLTDEERKLEAEIESGDWIPVDDQELYRLRSTMVEAAQGRGKEARVNLRLKADDVEKIRRKAEREGIPYQTLIGSVLHKYATDQLIEEKAVEAVIRKLGRKAAV